jgi:hypothetical protein
MAHKVNEGRVCSGYRIALQNQRREQSQAADSVAESLNKLPHEFLFPLIPIHGFILDARQPPPLTIHQ